jgi:hypothetical protein
MYEHKRCDNCHRPLEHGDRVTVIVPEVEVTGRYRKNHEGFGLKLSTDAIELRAAKVYCKKCLDIQGHVLKGDDDET